MRQDNLGGCRGIMIGMILGLLFWMSLIIFMAAKAHGNEPPGYVAPCRTVGHLQIPESECGR